MATVFDVAKYILEQEGPMTAMKLQKLVYYSQVWTLVWDEEKLFDERIEAWANGAVIPELFRVHRGMFKVSETDFSGADSNALTRKEKENIDRVVRPYAERTAQELSDINHKEDPWLNARGDLPPLAKSNAEITPGAIMEYYSGIWYDEEAE